MIDMCKDAHCDICPNFECVHRKNEEAIDEAIEAFDVPFSDFTECPFGGYCNSISCFGCKIYEDELIASDDFSL